MSRPIYALGILLFTLIASTGIGSFLSDRLPLIKAPWIFVFPLLTALAILVVAFLLNQFMSILIPTPLWTRIATAIILIAPIGLLLGMFFPTGMQIVRSISPDEIPWYWALNGIFGVLCSAIAVFISIYFGISKNFYIAALCYAMTTIALAGLCKNHPSNSKLHLPTDERIDPLADTGGRKRSYREMWRESI